MDKDEALSMASDFLNYLRRSDKSFIEKYTKKEIKCALSLIPASDGNKPWYKEMERRSAELNGFARERKWHKNYFWDKIFPIVLAGIISFIVGYSLKIVEVRNLKVEVKTLENRELAIRSEIQKAVASGDPSLLTAMFDRINRLSSVAEDDKRQFRMLADKLDDLEKKLAIALAKNDDTSASIISAELRKIRQKIERLKEWGNVP
jgi:hypothetical protein